MSRVIKITLAAISALAVVFIGANTFACGGKAAKTASQTTQSIYGVPAASDQASGVCPYTGTSCPYSGSGSGCPAMQGTQKAIDWGKHPVPNEQWTENVCGSKGYYAANVYQIRDGRMYAVCEGRTFEVTNRTPYTQVGPARYYFADEASRISCSKAMATAAPQIDREVVNLATTDGNVVCTENGQKIAQCPVTGTEFLVTADSPVKVVDGKKYYLNPTVVDLSTAH